MHCRLNDPFYWSDLQAEVAKPVKNRKHKCRLKWSTEVIDPSDKDEAPDEQCGSVAGKGTDLANQTIKLALQRADIWIIATEHSCFEFENMSHNSEWTLV